MYQKQVSENRAQAREQLRQQINSVHYNPRAVTDRALLHILNSLDAIEARLDEDTRVFSGVCNEITGRVDAIEARINQNDVAHASYKDLECKTCAYFDSGYPSPCDSCENPGTNLEPINDETADDAQDEVEQLREELDHVYSAIDRARKELCCRRAYDIKDVFKI